MKIDASGMHFKQLNQLVRETEESEILIWNCTGQRYIGDASSGKHITIQGTPGNALGAYLNGSTITVYGNAQDATGDTMNDGLICVYGSAGDACGYAMRGGAILIEGNAGYRAGIHMKAYQDKVPAVVIGGEAGSFLGEYQAGGIIVVLGLYTRNKTPVGRFCGTGMHGGKLFLRCQEPPVDLPEQVIARVAAPEDMEEIRPLLERFSRMFDKRMEEILDTPFHVLVPDTRNPYKRLYTPN